MRSKRVTYLGYVFYCSEKFGAGRYYYMNQWLHGKRRTHALHRFTWEYYNGAVPVGFHVHHKDGNPHNNHISNLEAIDGSEHCKQHARSMERVINKCAWCGKEYEVVKRALKRGFCSMSCQGMARKNTGVDHIMRTCAGCHREYRVWKYSHGRTCSVKCSWIIRRKEGNVNRHKNNGKLLGA